MINIGKKVSLNEVFKDELKPLEDKLNQHELIIGKIINSIQKITSELDILKNKTEELYSSAIRESIKGVAEVNLTYKIDEIKNEINNVLNRYLSQLLQTQNEINNMIIELKTKTINEITNKLEEKLNLKIESKLEKIENKIKEKVENIEKVEIDLSPIEKRLTELDMRLTKITEAIQQLSEKLEKLTEKVEDIHKVSMIIDEKIKSANEETEEGGAE